MLLEELTREGAEQFEVHTIGRSAAEVNLDVLDFELLGQQLNSFGADIVINAIAYTAVDKAESEPDLAYRLNADLPSRLADWCHKHRALLVHYSTDFVFDGMQAEPWHEWQETNPLSIYGKTKLAGEKALQMSPASSMVLRTAWVYGETGNNFAKTMLRLGRERDTLGVVDDQRGTPTYSRDIARATVSLIKQYQLNPERFLNCQHIYHLTSQGDTTWFGFASAIFDQARRYESLALKHLNAITTADYPTPAVRPSNSVLNCDELSNDFGIRIPAWQDSLEEVIQRLYQGDEKSPG
jgi:dTDP-4-dehydrorhamnose reductase